ncbi:cysteine-rich receptor-like protein kinase 10 isoform X2 [Alnus glutinosa]|uniref:cysteine-rich receptor-like protein kinase 10 isoform X2 n=1 Tax=Alnus glutinosa TaxID=3517 RepID=UPI002D78D4D6|nr:cysteine-rich receptor-like protein kinase 10 isoform X2 [Alnus glutinosa]
MGMASVNVSMTLVVFTLLCMSREAAGIQYLYHFCSNSTNLTFTPNSTYQSNLYRLLSSLSSNAGHEDGFYNTTVGQNASDIVYGLFLCRGDLSTQECQDCVDIATQEVINPYCPIEKTAVIWYEECMIRYSDQSFFSTMNTLPGVYVPSRENISDPDLFNEVLMATINDHLVSQGTNVRTGAKKFATKEANFSGSQTLYTLEQCTPDISSSDCSRCIQEAIALLSTCCSGRPGARILFSSCRIRYEIYSFYRTLNAMTVPTPMPSILPPPPSGKHKIRVLKITVSTTLVPAAAVLLVLGFYLLRRERLAGKDIQIAGNDVSTVEEPVESLQFDLATIEAATNNFSENNKLGKGGFGDVYKGILLNGQKIAVKRLLRSTTQDVKDFKNEVILVAKLQHRNLVRFLGFCLEGEEKILVYEFVANKSLDHFLYDCGKQRLLDWTTRSKIIRGIARGILYLHEDSHFKIIHRDLKASNILLEEDMNPKISDFGISKIFEVDQTQANTSRIFGTYGYMAPEYAIYGQYSVKSDVYSFGVLTLEILSGRKNISEDLKGYAWKLWRNGTLVEFLDPTLEDAYSSNEVVRCIHIALLCVQEDPADRPTMASIVLMLNSLSIALPSPHTRIEPNKAFKEQESDQLSSKSMSSSVNEVTITDLHSR